MHETTAPAVLGLGLGLESHIAHFSVVEEDEELQAPAKPAIRAVSTDHLDSPSPIEPRPSSEDDYFSVSSCSATSPLVKSKTSQAELGLGRPPITTRTTGLLRRRSLRVPTNSRRVSSEAKNPLLMLSPRVSHDWELYASKLPSTPLPRRE